VANAGAQTARHGTGRERPELVRRAAWGGPVSGEGAARVPSSLCGFAGGGSAEGKAHRRRPMGSDTPLRDGQGRPPWGRAQQAFSK